MAVVDPLVGDFEAESVGVEAQGGFMLRIQKKGTAWVTFGSG
jgi:hypothetical protein